MQACPQCSAPVADDSRYCSWCGTSLSAGSEAAPIDPAAAGGDAAEAAGSGSGAGRATPLPGVLLPHGYLTLAAGAVVAERFEILEVIGRGGMGTVFRAHDRELDDTVALKVIRADILPIEPVLERFRQETRLARRLAHPNIIKVYDLSGVGDALFLSMEYLDGVDLHRRLQAGGPLPVDEGLSVAAQVLDGLAFAHQSGVVHRDIKPHNIFLTRAGRVKLLDFGLAKAIDTTQVTVSGPMTGTPLYMAPEQLGAAGAGPADHRADLYAVGVVLFQTYTGQPPFRGATPIEIALKHLHEMPPAARTLRPDLPAHVDGVIRKALAKRPEDRYGSAEELRADLLGETRRYASYTPRPLDPALRTEPRDPNATDATLRAVELPANGADGPSSPTPDAPIAATPTTSAPGRARSRPARAALVVAVLAGLVGGGVAVAYVLSRGGDPRPASVDEAMVARELSAADALFERGQLFEPESANALTHYLAVLEAQRLNARALERVQQIRTAMMERADERLREAAAATDGLVAEAALRDARSFYDRARALNPDDPAVVELEQRIGVAATEHAERAERLARVEALLARARALAEQGREIEPPGDSAFDAYREALALAPEHAPAREGVERLTNRLVDEAERLASEDAFVARERLRLAQRSGVENEALATRIAALERNLAERIAARRATRTAGALVAQARARLAAGDLVRPEGDSALDLFLRVRELAPADAAATAGLAEVRDRLATAAEAQRAAGRRDAAHALYRDALRADPDDAATRAALGELERQLAAERKAAELAALLRRADGLRRSGQTIARPGTNAVDLYREVLARDPANAPARTALGEIRADVVARADVARARRRLDEAVALYRGWLALVPDDDDVAQRLAVTEQLVAREREQAMAARTVAALLEEGARFEAMGRLTSPVGGNALDAYRRALELEPGDPRVMDGLRSVERRLVAAGDGQVAKGNLRGALAYYERARGLVELGARPALDERIRDAQARLAAGPATAEPGSSPPSPATSPAAAPPPPPPAPSTPPAAAPPGPSAEAAPPAAPAPAAPPRKAPEPFVPTF